MKCGFSEKLTNFPEITYSKELEVPFWYLNIFFLSNFEILILLYPMWLSQKLPVEKYTSSNSLINGILHRSSTPSYFK